MNCNKKLANQHLMALIQQASKTSQYWLGFKKNKTKGFKKFTNLPYYAFLMERETEEEGEKRKKEPLFSCSPKYFMAYTCLMLDHQVFLKATQEKLERFTTTNVKAFTTYMLKTC